MGSDPSQIYNRNPMDKAAKKEFLRLKEEA